MLEWTPDYFKWDVMADVTVAKLYTRGKALLSNGFIDDEDGIAEWHRRVAGRVVHKDIHKGSTKEAA